MKTDPFACAAAVADALLYEGYVLYPYRASATKNQLRFQFGVLTPRSVSAADPSERSSMRTECLVDLGASPRLSVRVRFLHLQRRLGGSGAPWDEAIERQVDVADITLLPLAKAARDVAFRFDARDEIGDGSARRCEQVDGVVRVRAEWAPGSARLAKVRVTVENTSTHEPGADRTDSMRWSLVAVHTMLAVDDGVFVSLLDPPDRAVDAAKACTSEGTYPVLVGDGTNDVVLSSPIILYDHPAIATESEGDLFDATEIDEILALRVLTLTDDEKHEARRTDARAAAIVDRIDAFSPAVWERLHGTMRPVHGIVAEREPVPWWEPGADERFDPFTDVLVVAGRVVRAGTPVRLHPKRRSDAQDMFLVGMNATVTGVFTDVDDEVLVAVTVDDDPATEALAWQGRALFFHPDELEVLG